MNEHEVFKSPFLTVNEVAAFLRIKPNTLYKYTRKRLIKHYQFGRSIRFKREDIDAMFEFQSE